MKTLALRPALSAPAPVSLHDAPLATVARARSTPARLLQLGAAIVGAALLLALTLTHSAGSQRATLRAVGYDCAPSIVAAWRLRVALSALDASLVDQFLTAADPRDLDLARREMHRLRTELGTLLVEAAGNVTFGAAEKEPLVRLVAGLGQYEAEMMRAQTLERLGHHDGALEAAALGQNLLRGPLRNAAEALARVNADAFEAACRQGHDAAERQGWAMFGAFGLTAAALVGAQVYLQRRTRRLLNPGLLAASALWVLLAVIAGSRHYRASEALREARADAFASIAALWQTRASAAEANRLESRALLDPSVAAVALGETDLALAQILRRPAGVPWTRVRAELDGPRGTSGFDGTLAVALRNVTYPDEREALLNAAQEFARYAETDGVIRQLAASDRRAEAIRLCLSHERDGSNAAFTRLESALNRALDVNQAQFERALARGQSASSSLGQSACWLTLLLTGAALAGLWPRWREYAP